MSQKLRLQTAVNDLFQTSRYYYYFLWTLHYAKERGYSRYGHLKP